MFLSDCLHRQHRQRPDKGTGSLAKISKRDANINATPNQSHFELNWTNSSIVQRSNRTWRFRNQIGDRAWSGAVCLDLRVVITTTAITMTEEARRVRRVNCSPARK